ncbi:MAG: hypothetical protein HYT79_04735 [Elusimicrobia bacterium]|nr:hypothetical protein [Elusimicrobiota bacterium]
MLKRKEKKSPRPKNGLSKKTVGELLKKHPKTLGVFDHHGVHFCAGCFITLFSPLKKAAAYHAVENFDVFLQDVRRALRGRVAGPNHH